MLLCIIKYDEKDSKQRFKLMIDYPKNMFNFIAKNDVFPNLSIDINYNNILYSASQ